MYSFLRVRNAFSARRSISAACIAAFSVRENLPNKLRGALKAPVYTFAKLNLMQTRLCVMTLQKLLDFSFNV